MPDPEIERKRRDFLVKLPLIENEALRLGLYRTVRKINEAVKMAGYEVAGTPELYDTIEKQREEHIRRIGGPQHGDTK